MTKQNKGRVEIEDKKLLRGILLTLLEDKPRENKVKILKDVGFNQSEISDICGPAPSTLRWRKHMEKKSNVQ